MKDYMEFSAKTVDEAITKALLELGISSDRLEYEVIEKGSTGILGMFTRPAVIRVAKPAKDEDEYLLETPKKEEKISAKSSAKEEQKEESSQKAAVKECTEKDFVEESSGKETAAIVEPDLGGESAQPEFCEQDPAGKSSGKDSCGKSSVKASSARETGKEYHKNSKGRDRDSSREHLRAEKSSRKTGYAEKPAAEKPVLVKPEDPAMLELLQKVENFLSGMFGAMQMPVQVETGFDAEEKTILVNLTGGEMGVLIGKRGQTLDSIQYLCSLVVNKGEEEYIRVKVDTENYRERRKETLETLAKNISFKVKRTKRPISLEPMNPYERRVIHAALQNDKYVVTRSEGVEPYRHIVISPKNTRYNSKK